MLVLAAGAGCKLFGRLIDAITGRLYYAGRLAEVIRGRLRWWRWNCASLSIALIEGVAMNRAKAETDIPMGGRLGPIVIDISGR